MSVNEPLGTMRIRWYKTGDDVSLSLPRIEVEETRIFLLLPGVFALLDRLGKYVESSDLCEILQEHFGFTNAAPSQESLASPR